VPPLSRECALKTLDRDPGHGVRAAAKYYLSALSTGPVAAAPESFYISRDWELLSQLSMAGLLTPKLETPSTK
jgi:hypothetical protein